MLYPFSFKALAKFNIDSSEGVPPQFASPFSFKLINFAFSLVYFPTFHGPSIFLLLFTYGPIVSFSPLTESANQPTIRLTFFRFGYVFSKWSRVFCAWVSELPSYLL